MKTFPNQFYGSGPAVGTPENEKAVSRLRAEVSAVAIAHAHYEADVGRLPVGESLSVGGPIKRRTDSCSIQDDLREICGYVDSDFEHLTNDDFDKIVGDVVKMYDFLVVT